MCPKLTVFWFTQRFIDNKWEEVTPDDALRLNKYQAQVWLAVYNLVMDNNMRAK